MSFSYFLLAFLLASPASAAVRAVATTPDVAWLLYQVGGSNVEVKTLAKSGDNYHFLDARPDYILAVSRADLFCRVGADLEIGWAPKLVEKAANRKVMPGASGDCDLSRQVSLQEAPTSPVDRSMGDVHPTGNPHYWLSPKEMVAASKEVEAKLSSAMPEKAEEFSKNRLKLEQDLKSIQERTALKLKNLSGKGVYQYHKDFSYFLNLYGLRLLGSIEEIPGVSPSAARLGKVSLEAKAAGAILAMASKHDPQSALAKFQEASGVPVVSVNSSLSNPADPKAYELWQDSLAEGLLSVKK
jgi:zinc/manganese transport system substrate-binding protein